MGYSGNGFSCTNINECAENGTNDCDTNAQCSDNDGSYTCQCIDGYNGNGWSCTDINECAVSEDNDCLDTIAECTNTATTLETNYNVNGTPVYNIAGDKYTCNCRSGYTGDGVKCTDTNECYESNICDINAKCLNTIGSYTCTCNAPYWEGDGTSCTDIDECLDGTHDCASVYADIGIPNCSNHHDGFTCSCPNGFALNDDNVCYNINECTTMKSPCQANAFCFDSIGSHTCECNNGYVDSDGVCDDINECDNGTHNCANAACNNIDGSFFCVCESGYVGEPDCTDVNECFDTELYDCDQNAFCNNTVGSYKCVCNLGYSGNGLSCNDIDECNDENKCGINTDCDNTDGSYNCICSIGYEGDANIGCININECATDSHNCHANATCTDTQGLFSCTCNSGFDGSGIVCVDVNECALQLDHCGANSVCDNYIGSYDCFCIDEGYRAVNGSDESICENINECIDADLTHNCNSNGLCIDNDGSFQCICNVGFSGDGIECVNIDECLIEYNNNCHSDATCIDTFGSFHCDCNNGYTGDGVDCINIDECGTDVHNCHSKATCLDIIGSFRCSCNKGYSGNGVECANVDECMNGNHLCNQICEDNSPTTQNQAMYTCKCQNGYRLQSNEVTCLEEKYFWGEWLEEGCLDPEATNENNRLQLRIRERYCSLGTESCKYPKQFEIGTWQNPPHCDEIFGQIPDGLVQTRVLVNLYLPLFEVWSDRLLNSSSEEFIRAGLNYKSTMNSILSKVEDNSQKNGQVAFSYSRLKSFIRGSTTAGKIRQRKSAAEEIFAEFEAIFNVLGESNAAADGKLIPQAEAELIAKVTSGLQRELKSVSAVSSGYVVTNYVPGELNFFRQITDTDIAIPVMEKSINETFGPWINDCDCGNQIRSDYAVCTTADSHVNVRPTNSLTFSISLFI